MPESIHLLLLALLGSIVALAGGIIFLYNKKLSESLKLHAAPFAAGVLITVSLLGLIPEATDYLGHQALTIVLVSFFAAYIFEHFITDIHHHDCNHRHKEGMGSVPLVIIGDTIHNFIDGVAIGASFFASPAMGLTTAFSSFLHEIPHEIGDFAILLKNGWAKRDILLVNIVSASTTILGAFSVRMFADNPLIIGSLLSVAAGIFLYLGAIDFLPHATDGFKSRFKAIIPLLLGIASMIVTFSLVPHEHEHDSVPHWDEHHPDAYDHTHDDDEHLEQDVPQDMPYDPNQGYL